MASPEKGCTPCYNGLWPSFRAPKHERQSSSTAPAGCSLLHTGLQCSVTPPFNTVNNLTNIAGDTHASRGFQKQISRAHRLHRTPLCWCSVRKYRHGNMAPSTKGSSSVLQAGWGN